MNGFWSRERHVILMVTDAEAAAGVHPAFLRRPGIRIVDTHRAQQALELARRLRPSLIIEDLDARAGEAAELCAGIKSDAATRPIPVIQITAGGAGAATPEPTGPDVRLRKPLVQREYFEAVQRFLPLPRRRDLREAVNLRFTYDDGHGEYQAFSRDLSTCGAFLKTDRPVEEGTHLHLRFRLPGLDESIVCGGVVRRLSEPGDRPPIAGFGVEFEGISDADLERLQDFIGRRRRRSVFSRS